MIRSFSQRLLTWYQSNARKLPWRESRDPYHIWISEAMLQQTTVKTVLGYYPAWLKTFPTIKSLANAPMAKVLKAWQGLGYYNRARNLHRSAQIIISKYNGDIPSDPEILRQLPGFGPYMSSSVASIAFDIKVPLVDANVRRVIMRIKNIHGHAKSSLDKDILEFLNDLMPSRHCGDFNQALMELGAMLCISKEPQCNLCPIHNHCQAFKEGCQNLIPEPKKIILNKIKSVAGIITNNNQYLIQQRPEKGLLAGLWEFPGGKVTSDDINLKSALKRKLLEAFGQTCCVGDELMSVTHYYTTNKIHLTAFHVKLKSNYTLKPNQRWTGLEDIQYPMTSGSAKIIKKLLKKSR